MSQIPTEKFKDPVWILQGYNVNAFVLTKNQLLKLSELIGQIDLKLSQEKTISLTIRIKGHTDSIGDELYNLNLGSRRADYAASQIKKQIGKRKNAFKVKYRTSSEGEGKPIAPNFNKDTRFNNRRLEIYLEWEIVRVPKQMPASIPIRSKPVSNDPYIEYNSCAEFLKFKRRFGVVYKRLLNLYGATGLHWELGSPIGLRTIEPKSIISNLTEELQNKLFDEAKDPLMNKIFGARNSAILGAVITHVNSIKMISDDVENEKIMRDKEKRRDVHFKLVCALYAGVDIKTSDEWVKYYRDYKKFQDLEFLCNKERGYKGRGPQYKLPPSGIKQSSTSFGENQRGIKNRGVS